MFSPRVSLAIFQVARALRFRISVVLETALSRSVGATASPVFPPQFLFLANFGVLAIGAAAWHRALCTATHASGLSKDKANDLVNEKVGASITK